MPFNVEENEVSALERIVQMCEFDEAQTLWLANKFDFIDIAGKGAHSVVARVIDRNKTNVEYALKIYRRGTLQTRHTEIRREAIIGTKISHPNVVRYFNFEKYPEDSQNPELVCLLLEYVPGNNLRDILKEERLGLGLKKSLSIVSGVASGLAALHDNKIVHCDVKPEQILLTDQGVPKIGDNSVSVIINEDSQSTGLSGDYAAPERMKNIHNNPLSDIYSLGIVLYEMLTGPLHKQTTTIPQSPSQLYIPIGGTLEKAIDHTRKNVDISKAPWITRRLLKSMLHENPARRPSAKKVAARAKRLHDVVQMYDRIVDTCKTHPKKIAFSAALLIGAAAAVGYGLHVQARNATIEYPLQQLLTTDDRQEKSQWINRLLHNIVDHKVRPLLKPAQEGEFPFAVADGNWFPTNSTFRYASALPALFKLSGDITQDQEFYDAAQDWSKLITFQETERDLDPFRFALLEDTRNILRASQHFDNEFFNPSANFYDTRIITSQEVSRRALESDSQVMYASSLLLIGKVKIMAALDQNNPNQQEDARRVQLHYQKALNYLVRRPGQTRELMREEYRTTLDPQKSLDQILAQSSHEKKQQINAQLQRIDKISTRADWTIREFVIRERVDGKTKIQEANLPMYEEFAPHGHPHAPAISFGVAFIGFAEYHNFLLHQYEVTQDSRYKEAAQSIQNDLFDLFNRFKIQLDLEPDRIPSVDFCIADEYQGERYNNAAVAVDVGLGLMTLRNNGVPWANEQNIETVLQVVGSCLNPSGQAGILGNVYVDGANTSAYKNSSSLWSDYKTMLFLHEVKKMYEN